MIHRAVFKSHQYQIVTSAFGRILYSGTVTAYPWAGLAVLTLLWLLPERVRTGFQRHAAFPDLFKSARPKKWLEKEYYKDFFSAVAQGAHTAFTETKLILNCILFKPLRNCSSSASHIHRSHPTLPGTSTLSTDKWSLYQSILFLVYMDIFKVLPCTVSWSGTGIHRNALEASWSHHNWGWRSIIAQ